ncbi:unnamed protein product [Ambrosiozyma monospora]|uniref:Unnamed protein product n=1 Tax=Ambrosiozyma monospora TaxID=43982 RepID=A0ACB5U1W7_AMBMO|nr:unnamed protein product [Ambrosiozyma monospora]
MSSSSTSSLRTVPPEPITLNDDPIPGIPTSGSPSKPFTLCLIPALKQVQKYSTIPFSIFAILHVSAVVVAPATAGTGIAEELISAGRELYQVSGFEQGLLISTLLHVFSGVALSLLRQYDRYIKYGSRKARVTSTRKKASKFPSSDPNDEIVDDKNEGLGGISSLLGLGSRKSLTYKYLGLSPLSFSGYVLVACLAYHVVKERINPLLVDGDSSMVDLSYVSHAINLDPLKTIVGMSVLVGTSAYHILSGWNRYLKLFTLRARKRTYGLIAILTALAFVSCFEIKKIGPAYGVTAKTFNAYIEAL